MKNIIITTPDVERLKKHAKILKKEENITHSEALECVAKQIDFNHWHDVTISNKKIRDAEEAFKKGCVIGFDVKDGLDTLSDDFFIQDSLLEVVGEKHIFKVCCNTIDPDDSKGRTFKETLSSEELEEYFRENYSFWYFRLSAKALQYYPTIEKMLNFVLERFYFPPMICFVEGKQIDVFKVLAEDESGNLQPLRQAGGFPNNSVVEYATINITILYRFLPNNLKEPHWSADEDSPITLSISPNGRLTHNEIVLESTELAEQFVKHLKKKLKRRSYGNHNKMQVAVKTDTRTKTITKKKLQHTELVKKELGLVKS
jgi:hypothetical protein